MVIFDGRSRPATRGRFDDESLCYSRVTEIPQSRMTVVRREERCLSDRELGDYLSQLQRARFSFRALRRWPASTVESIALFFVGRPERGAVFALTPPFSVDVRVP